MSSRPGCPARPPFSAGARKKCSASRSPAFSRRTIGRTAFLSRNSAAHDNILFTAAHRQEIAKFDPSEITRAEEAVLIERRSEEHTSELQSLMRIAYAVFSLNKK